jgi:hypothetical protein
MMNNKSRMLVTKLCWLILSLTSKSKNSSCHAFSMGICVRSHDPSSQLSLPIRTTAGQLFRPKNCRSGRHCPTHLPAAAATATATAQYASQALGLFNNMKLPASIIAGAIVPLGFIVPLQLESEPDDTQLERRVRKLYPLISSISLASELIAVMWGTIATNQLTERSIPPAKSVWHLIQRDFELEWMAVNSHFCIGMFGFLAMIGSRAYFATQKGLLGKSVSGVAVSGLALMVSIVNRGVASGGGTDVSTGTTVRVGANVVALFLRYITLLLGRAISLKTFGILELFSVSMLVLSIFTGLKAVFQNNSDAWKEEN